MEDKLNMQGFYSAKLVVHVELDGVNVSEFMKLMSNFLIVDRLENHDVYDDCFVYKCYSNLFEKPSCEECYPTCNRCLETYHLITSYNKHVIRYAIYKDDDLDNPLHIVLERERTDVEKKVLQNLRESFFKK